MKLTKYYFPIASFVKLPISKRKTPISKQTTRYYKLVVIAGVCSRSGLVIFGLNQFHMTSGCQFIPHWKTRSISDMLKLRILALRIYHRFTRQCWVQGQKSIRHFRSGLKRAFQRYKTLVDQIAMTRSNIG